MFATRLCDDLACQAGGRNEHEEIERKPMRKRITSPLAVLLAAGTALCFSVLKAEDHHVAAMEHFAPIGYRRRFLVDFAPQARTNPARISRTERVNVCSSACEPPGRSVEENPFRGMTECQAQAHPDPATPIYEDMA
jgi:hypothetical protein